MHSIKLFVLLVAVVLLFVTVTLAEINSETKVQHEESRVLSRKRRYLIFPSGSSFQVVYDGIYPIIGWTTLFILGVTCALAWQLPSEPVNLQELSAKLHANDNKVEMAVDAVKNATEDDASKTDKDISGITYIDSNSKYSNYGLPPKFNYASNVDRNDLAAPMYYSESGPVYDKSKYHTYYNRAPVSGYKNTYYPSSKINDKAGENYSKKPPSRYSNFNDDIISTISKFAQNPQLQNTWKHANWGQITDTFKKLKPAVYTDKKGNRHHMVYPQIGKRSIAQPHLDVEDKLFLHHHRNTRHDLYTKISKFLDVQGVDGKQCILKTLCETGEKRDEIEPGSFLSEIFRAVFSFPKPHYQVDDADHVRYDEAHGIASNCSHVYSKCQLNIWNENWML